MAWQRAFIRAVLNFDGPGIGHTLSPCYKRHRVVHLELKKKRPPRFKMLPPYFRVWLCYFSKLGKLHPSMLPSPFGRPSCTYVTNNHCYRRSAPWKLMASLEKLSTWTRCVRPNERWGWGHTISETRYIHQQQQYNSSSGLLVLLLSPPSFFFTVLQKQCHPVL